MRHAQRSGISGAVYALTDPFSGEVRYVGQALDPNQRLRTHMSEARAADRAADATTGRSRNWHRINWLRQLPGCRPDMVILEQLADATVDDLCAREKEWIAHFRAVGAQLTNKTDGGEGSVGYRRSAEQLAAMSERTRQQFADPEARRRTAEAVSSFYAAHPEQRALLAAKTKAHNEAHPQSKETRRKRTASLKAFNQEHPEVRLRAVAGLRGQKQEPEFAARRSAAVHSSPKWQAAMVARRGQSMTAENVAKVVAGRRAGSGYAPSDETRRKMSEARRGLPMAEETKAKIAEGVRAAWQRKREVDA